MRVRTEFLSGGVAGTDRTVRVMMELVEKALLRGRVRLHSLQVVDGTGPDVVGRARQILSWVSANITEISDPVDVETVQAPEVTLEVGAGDCDDHSVLISTMLEAVGIPTRFE
jgi:transglutaminase-like putative cysteine protease